MLEPKGVNPMSESSSLDPERILHAARSWIWEHTIGLYMRRKEGNPVMVGSGVLLKVADVGFVLSAGHVLKEMNGAEFLFGSMSAGGRLISTTEHLEIRVTTDERTYDLGVVALPDVVASKLIEQKKRFLRITDLDLVREPLDGFYSVAGYPQVTNSPDYQVKEISAEIFYYGTCLDHGTITDSTPGVTIALYLREEKLTRVSEEKGERESVRMPILKGISGGGIWRLYADNDNDRIDSWKPTWIRLSGIEHGVLKRSIKGTLVGYAIGFIAQNFRSLENSIRLYMPE